MNANASGIPPKFAATPENVVNADRIQRGVPSRLLLELAEELLFLRLVVLHRPPSGPTAGGEREPRPGVSSLQCGPYPASIASMAARARIPELGVIRLKIGWWSADIGFVDAAERREILSRYIDHQRRFEAAAARRSGTRGGQVIPFQAPLQELEQEPTNREIEVLQLISEGLVNREIGQRLFLSEETVMSHVS